MRIHVHCPGSMQDGFDSPTRGEGRWTQNLARVLAGAGHSVVVSAGGIPKWGRCSPVDNVILVPETRVFAYSDKDGGFDLDIDPTRWKGKPHMVKAKRHLTLKWSLEDYTREEPLPYNEFLCFPFSHDAVSFLSKEAVNRDRSFLLPLPFGDTLKSPNFDANTLLWTSKDIDREEFLRTNAKMVAEEVLPSVLSTHPNLYVVWLMYSTLRKYNINVSIRAVDRKVNDLLLYSEIRNVLRACKLVVSINIPGSVFDAIFEGVPTLEWEGGGFFNEIGRKHNVLIPRSPSVQEVKDIILNLLSDKDLYNTYVRDIQEQVKDNTNASALEHFNLIAERIM